MKYIFLIFFSLLLYPVQAKVRGVVKDSAG